jgi:hypothetical protein
MNHLRWAIRQLLRQPGLSVTVIVTLALAIGAKHSHLQLCQRPSTAAISVSLPGATDRDFIVTRRPTG